MLIDYLSRRNDTKIKYRTGPRDYILGVAALLDTDNTIRCNNLSWHSTLSQTEKSMTREGNDRYYLDQSYKQRAVNDIATLFEAMTAERALNHKKGNLVFRHSSTTAPLRDKHDERHQNG